MSLNSNKILNVPNLRFKEFTDEYENCIIKDLLKIKSGQDQKKVCDPNGRYKIYGTGGVIGFTNTPLYDKESVGIGRKGTIDRPFYFNEPFWTVDTLFYSEIKNNNCAKYIYYLFQTINWHKYDESTGVPSLSASTIEHIKTKVPKRNEQDKISKFLTLIDERIETQNKIIEDLQVLKKSIDYALFSKNSKIMKENSKVPLNFILKERNIFSQKNDVYEHVTLSKDGILPKGDRYNRDFLVKDEEKKYKITKINDICYNPANLKFGVICRNNYGTAIFSPIYVTYEINQKYEKIYIEHAIINDFFIGNIRRFEEGTVYERMAVSSEDFLKGKIPLPNEKTQKNISELYLILEKELTKEKLLLEKYKEQKIYLLNNMFI